MDKNNKLFEDFSKLTSSAFSSLASMRDEMQNYAQQKFEQCIKKSNLVTREEFEILQKRLEKIEKNQKIIMDKLELDTEKPKKKKTDSK